VTRRRLRWHPRWHARGRGGDGWAGVAPCHSTRRDGEPPASRSGAFCGRRIALAARAPARAPIGGPPSLPWPGARLAAASHRPGTCRLCEWTAAVVERTSAHPRRILDASPCRAQATRLHAARRTPGRLLPKYRHTRRQSLRRRQWRCVVARTDSRPLSPASQRWVCGVQIELDLPSGDLHEEDTMVGCPRCAFLPAVGRAIRALSPLACWRRRAYLRVTLAARNDACPARAIGTLLGMPT
jgi:hypothetical protein